MVAPVTGDVRVKVATLQTNQLARLIPETIPELCPDCQCGDWQFDGSASDGLKTVWCPQCGRTYQRFDTWGRLAYTSSMLADSARMRETNRVNVFYNASVHAFNDLIVDGGDGSQWVCTREGGPAVGFDDDIPL